MKTHISIVAFHLLPPPKGAPEGCENKGEALLKEVRELLVKGIIFTQPQKFDPRATSVRYPESTVYVLTEKKLNELKEKYNISDAIEGDDVDSGKKVKLAEVLKGRTEAGEVWWNPSHRIMQLKSVLLQLQSGSFHTIKQQLKLQKILLGEFNVAIQDTATDKGISVIR